MKKKMLPLVTVLALLTMPVSQAMAAPKPTPPADNSGGQMSMSSSQMAASQPAMSGWDMVKMRTTAKMRAKAARNAKLKGKPAQAVAASTFSAAKGPDYFGSSPNYASSSMPHITWKAVLGHTAGENVILPLYDPTSGMLSNVQTGAKVDVADSPYALAPDAVNLTKLPPDQLPLIDPINQIPQLDLGKVDISGGIRKFVAPLLGLGAAGAGTTLNYDITGGSATEAYIPTATPDTTTYPGADYYEIGLKDYYQEFSPDIPKTKLRGYYQMNDSTGAASRPFYLGPVIVAQADRPVRIKFVNQLPNGAGGDLFIPTDTTAMGAGTGPDGTTDYTQNRATLHLHGGLSPWISDGTPHQWTTPVGSAAKYPKGVSVTSVPDMPAVQTVNQDGTAKAGNAASDGSLTFYYTNAQSARLMWYHDHAYGLTRLNVYVGEVAGYVLQDPYEKGLTAATSTTVPNPVPQPCLDVTPPVPPATCVNPDPTWTPTITQAAPPVIPGDEGIPLIIQDKAFVPEVGAVNASGYFPDGQLAAQDPTWDTTKWGGTGSLWFPHVYMPNQNPYDNSGAAPMGRWDYGPWFWPIFGTAAGLVHGEVANPYATPAGTTACIDNSVTPAAHVQPAADGTCTAPATADPLWAPWEPPMIPGTPSTYTLSQGLATSDVSLVPEGFVDTAVVNGVAYPYLDVDPKAYRFRILNGANDRYWNLQMYCSAADKPAATGLYNAASGNLPVDPTLPMWAGPGARVPQNAAAGEVPMVPAVRTAGFPAEWPTDGRAGGVPDPAATAGNFLQIGTESGVLPNAVVVPNQPVNYVYNRRDIIVLSISTHALLLGPAERADVVFDFAAAKAKGCTNVILYNDAPTPVPAFDPRNDYYSNNGDQTDSGGTPSTLPGYGPNTRTIMQFRISGAAPVSFDAAKLTAAVPVWFAATQHKPIVPETRYHNAYPTDPIGGSDVYSRIQSNNLAFSSSSVGDIGSLTLAPAGSGYAPTATAAVAAPGTAAALVPVFNGAGRVTSVTVVKGGTGYAPNQNTNGNNGVPVVISQPIGGTAAVAHAATNALGVITSVKVNSGGNRYTSGATVTIAAPPAGGFTATATATVNLNNGVISALTLTDVGNGYAVAPAAAPVVTISGPLYVGGVQAVATATVANGAANVNVAMEPKAIQELFEMDYGRMNATLGVELPFTNAGTQTTLPLGYAEPTSEFMKPTQLGTQIGTTRNGTEIWKITHNGVDTHTIHFHLSDVQLVNRVGWDGAIRPPDDNELGWKESVRMNPLEDAIVAMRPETPPLPFKIGDSVRVIDPTMPANHQMTTLDPLTGNAVTYTNAPVSFGWEYVWHCHLLGHEENDMMRPVDFKGSPDAPTLNSVAKTAGNPRPITVTWTNNANWQLTNYVIQRTSATGNNPQPNWANAVQTLSDKGPLAGAQPWQGTAPTTLGGVVQRTATSFVDPGAGKVNNTTYFYRVRAESAQGVSAWSTVRSVRY